MPRHRALISPSRRSEPRIDAVIGGVAGLASGLLGVGGGFLMVPLQVMWGHSDQRRASGTSLAAIVPIALVGAVVYYFAKGAPQVDLTVAFFLVLGSAGGAFAGARLARKVPEHALKMLVAILLVVVGLKEVHDAVLGASSSLRGSTGTSLDLERYLLITLSGLIIGILSGLTGIGGGIFLVPTMVLGFGLSQRVAQGTSLVAILPTAAVGAITHHQHGNVDVRGAGWIAISGVPTALVGSVLALWLPEPVLPGIFGLFLLFAATRIWPRRSPLSVVANQRNEPSEADNKT